MTAVVGSVIVLVSVLGAPAGPLVEGRVRLESGQPAAGVQVRLFDLADLRRSVGSTTDGAGHFALSVQALSKAQSASPADGFALGANYPNPFNPSTMIPYHLSTPGQVRLEVFNVLGQRVATLVDGHRPAGAHRAEWTAADAEGQAAAGVYFYRLTVAGEHRTRRMLLIDGQAGIPAGAGGSSLLGGGTAGAAGETAPVYGLTVSGPGLVPYVDPAFRVEAGMARLDLVVAAPGRVPTAKAASSGGGILGDVDNTGRVDIFDALLVAVYSANASLVMPNDGDISLGDVNADGRVDLSDAWLIATWLDNPSDPSLPAGIGEPVGAATASLSPDPSTVAFAADGSWHRFAVEAGEAILVVVNPGSARPRLEITTESGRGNYCPPEANDETSRRDGQAIYLAGCVTGAATVELRRAATDSVLRTYTFTVTGGPDLVAQAPFISPVSPRPGQDFTLSVTVRNQGGEPSAATTLRYYRSSNRSISTGDTIVGRAAVDSLAASGSRSESIVLPAPESAGTYYYGACVASVVGESDARNNCSPAVTLTVADGGLAAGTILRLTDHQSYDWGPSWSPDGSRIAFGSDRDGNNEIYVMDSDGSNLRRLTDHPGDDGSPSWSPDGRSIAFQSDRDGDYEIYVMESDGSNVRRLTDHSGGDGSPSWSPDGGRVAFQSDRDGNNEIYVMESDGSNVRRLTDDPGGDGSPSWSPDGGRIAFSSDRDGNNEIYVMESDGSNVRRLTDHWAIDESPSWSPDGGRIAFSSDRDGDYEIYVMESDGSNVQRLTDHSGIDWEPSWSPDGGRIAFSSDRDGNYEIYVMELRAGSSADDHGNIRAAASRLPLDSSLAGEIEPAGDVDYFRVEVGESGVLSVYTTGGFDTMGALEDSTGTTLESDDDGGGGTNFSIERSLSAGTYYIKVEAYGGSSSGSYTIHARAAGSADGAVALTSHLAIDGSPSWSPDGGRVAFTSDRAGNYEIYVMDSDGSDVRRLTDHPGDDGSPSWSPDGRSIAFSSDRAGDYEIYVMDSDGSNVRRLTDDPGDDGSLSWSPDGRSIAFSSDRAGDYEIYVMDSDGSNVRRLTDRSGSDWEPSWSPDGRRIAFSSARDGDYEIYVMDSGGSNVRRLTDRSGSDWEPSWSPDGRRIAFMSDRAGDYEIYVMGSDGSNVRRLTDDPGDDGSPSWSPDGGRVAFMSDRDGDYEIYVIEFRE